MTQNNAFQAVFTATEDFSLEKGNNIFIVRCADRLDINNAPVFKSMINMLIEQKRYSIIVNFENLKHLDSSGLGVLVNCLIELQNKNGFLKIFRPGIHIKKIFEITGAADFFDFYENDEDIINTIT